MGIQGVCKTCGFSPTLDYACLRCTEKARDAALGVIGEMMKWCCSACGLFVKNDPAFLKAFAAKPAPETPFTQEQLKALQDSPFKGPNDPWPKEKRMAKRMTDEELAKFHDGLCRVSIGDGECSCLVSWVKGLQKDSDEALQAMNDTHSLLSLVRHRHLPKGLDLEKDIDKALGASEKALAPWWKMKMQQTEKRKCGCVWRHQTDSCPIHG